MRPDAGAFCCMCEPEETAQSLGDDTHAAVARAKGPRWHGLHRGVVYCVGVREACFTDWCSNKDAGRSERRTPDPFVNIICVRQKSKNQQVSMMDS